MYLLQIALSALVALLLLGTGLAKIAGAHVSRRDAARFGFTYPQFRLIGALELAGSAGLTVGLFVPWAAVVAGLGVVVLMIGAVLTHLRSGDPVVRAVPAATVCVLSGITVGIAL